MFYPSILPVSGLADDMRPMGHVIDTRICEYVILLHLFYFFSAFYIFFFPVVKYCEADLQD
jgi:hypothetical protein